MSEFKEYLDEQLQDPVFKAEYDALEDEFTIIQVMIDARKKEVLPEKIPLLLKAPNEAL